MSGHHVGIDYGTSHTVAVVRWCGGRMAGAVRCCSTARRCCRRRCSWARTGALGAGRDAQHSARLELGTVATVLAAIAVPEGLALLVLSRLDSDDGNDLVAAGIAVLVAGLLVALVAIALLRSGLRAHPRLVVHAEGITYQPDARYRYDLPWTDLARVDLAQLAPGRPPALIAVPSAGSPLAHDLAGDQRWRPDLGALVVEDLDRLSQRLAIDVPDLARALAYYRTPVDQGYGSNRP